MQIEVLSCFNLSHHVIAEQSSDADKRGYFRSRDPLVSDCTFSFVGTQLGLTNQKLAALFEVIRDTCVRPNEASVSEGRQNFVAILGRKLQTQC